MERMEATRETYGRVLAELGERDERIVVLDADLSSSTRTSIFAKKFPHRFFNVGIAEQNMMGMAAGLSTTGKVPFVSTFAIFATGRAWEPIRQSICYSHFNVKIVATHAGITVGEDGASHQVTEDIALMRVIPGMTVIVPADAVETEKVIQSIVDFNGPVYVRLSRAKFPVVFDKDYTFEIGKGKIVRHGKDVAIIAIGLMVSQALKAAQMLLEENIQATVVNMSTVKPIDAELIKRVAGESGAVVTCEEHSIIGGLGSAVAEVLSESINVPLVRVGIQDTFGSSGKSDELIKYFHLMPSDIVEAAKKSISRKKTTR
jgi:transketolase